MTNSEIKKRLPKLPYFISTDNQIDNAIVCSKLVELYDKTVTDNKFQFRNINNDIDKYNSSSFLKTKISLGIIVSDTIMFGHNYGLEDNTLTTKVFLKYFEEDYSDKLEYIELSQYEKGLLQISINKFVKDCENFGEELLNIDLNDYVNILGKLSE